LSERGLVHLRLQSIDVADEQGTAGVVLAGGRSSRMGRPKAALEWHGLTLLYRTAAVLARAVSGPTVVVAAVGQDLPALPAGVEVVEDPVPGMGPMQGIATGLAAVAERAGGAFVCSTDLPFLHPMFAAVVLRSMESEAGEEVDVVMPVVKGFRQPLAAAYRTEMAGLIQDRVAEGELRPGMLLRHCRVRQLDEATLLADPVLSRLDPELDSVVNVNEPDDYAAARRRPPPEVVVERFGALASGGHRGPRRVRAATLGAAASGAEVVLDRHVLAALNGEQITRDPEVPLVRGDVVAFLTADGGG
jgi:molybdopterin-guanine dinucleotide biosynthesis protein A